jgi:predicted GNAT family acetyltransferase
MGTERTGSRGRNPRQRKETLVHKDNRAQPFEYPDTAGYPDGSGFLDEGTSALVDEVVAAAVRDVDEPSADADSDIIVLRNADTGFYIATKDGRDIAHIRFEEVDGRVVLLATTVEPEFRGRGIATALIADALDDIRQRGKRVTVYCPVIAAFIAGNVQFSDLVDPHHPGS